MGGETDGEENVELNKFEKDYLFALQNSPNISFILHA
jgi:hypothetical protein